MSRHNMTVGQFYPEGRVGQNLHYGPFVLNYVVFRQNNPS